MAASNNKKLSRISFITATGDYMSLFAYVTLLADLGKNPIYAGLVLPTQGIGNAIGAFFFPRIVSNASSRTVLFATQFSMGLLSLFLLLYWSRPHAPSVYVILLICLLQSALGRSFTAAKETYSKQTESDELRDKVNSHRSLQAQLEKGMLAGQFLGPLIFFVLVGILKLPVTSAIALDTVTFFAAALMTLNLKNFILQSAYLHILNPLKYLSRSPALLQIFLIRGVGMWVSLGLYNLLLFPLTKTNYGLDIVYSTWVYSLIGFGALISTRYLQSHALKLKNTSLLIGSFFGFAAVFPIYGFSRSLFLGALSTVFVGVTNGIHKVSTRAIMRELCNESEYAETLSLEFFIGKAVEIIVVTVSISLLPNEHQWPQLVWISSAVFCIMAVWVMVSKRVEKFSQ